MKSVPFLDLGAVNGLIRDELDAAFRRVLDSGWFIMGPELEAFEADPDTKAIVMIGEIGGDAEERAAAYIQENITKPVVGYVAGFTAPEGKTMGHAGAIVSGSAGTAQAKKEALEAAGAAVSVK